MNTLSDTAINTISHEEQPSPFPPEIHAARKCLDARQYEKALALYEKGLNHLISKNCQENSWGNFQPETAGRLSACVLTFSDLSFTLGRGFVPALRFLESTGPIAEKLGDRRAKALIDLHTGRLFYLGNRRKEAMVLMQKAEAEVNDLGDADIRIRAAEFLALYYYMQGRFSEAMVFFETGFQAFETGDGNGVANPSAPIFYGYCTAYLGQFHKAIGNLDSAWRQAKQQKNHAYAATLRASLGMILLLTKKEKQALAHIEGAAIDAETHHNIFGWYFARGYMAYYHYLQGRYQAACDLLKAVAEKARQANILQWSSPWLLEMVFDLQNQGYAIFPADATQEIVTAMIKDPSLHIRGVLLRLLAQETRLSGFSPANKDKNILHENAEALKAELGTPHFPAADPEKTVKMLLIHSETLLTATGDPVQLAKTRITMARAALAAGDRKTAISLAGKARKGLSGFWEDYFPDGIRALLDEHPVRAARDTGLSIDSEQLLQAVTELAPSLDMNDFFVRVVATMNRLLRAEKGGLFWAAAPDDTSLVLRAARHLNASDITNPNFSANLEIIEACFKSGKPIMRRSDNPSVKLPRYHVFSLVCIPVKQKNLTTGVLYYDNSYLDGCFDFLDMPLLEKIAGLLTVYIERIQKIQALISDARTFRRDPDVAGGNPPQHPILARSRTMMEMLESLAQIAASDSAVLIQGETGAGKELMARRLHELSPRHKKSFVIIDSTTLVDNLVESELFGYEKGAFTGADTRKHGRIEHAHGGTLFIDEIGEMPKFVQAKLLRVLQEKTVVRIGGSQPIGSDFRLLAATNRDLAAEVGQGRFRKDLYYRISTVPLFVPPLRDRKEDIVLLARHFFRLYAKKYHQGQLFMTSEHEQALINYHWPGNVRELINVIERAVILSKGNRLALNLETSSAASDAGPFADTPTMADLQRRYIEYVLNKTGGKISGKDGAARIMGMKRSTLYSRMDKLGIAR